MKSVVVGTAGHIDHGKSALVRALTGVDPDRLKEEKARGITIDLGFAQLRLGDLTVAFVDVPGHERFVKNMLAGASGIDLVLLTVAADESVMPQTREHFDICRLLHVPAGIVALTKADLVDPEGLELASLGVRELVAGSFLENAPIIPVSSRTRQGLEALRVAQASAAANTSGRAPAGPTRQPIDRVFSVKGFGTVVTGTLVSGRVRPGDELVIEPGGRRVTVRGLQVHGADQREATAGERSAVNLAGVDVSDVVRGQVLVSRAAFTPTVLADVRIETLPDAKPLKHGARVRCHQGTAEILGRVAVIGPSESGKPAVVPPGARAYARLRLERPAVLARGDRYILRAYSPPRTIAGGVVLDPAPPRSAIRSQAAVDRCRRLDEHAPGTAEAQLAAAAIMVAEAGAGGLPVAALVARAAIGPGEVDARVEQLAQQRIITRVGDVLVVPSVLDRLKTSIVESLDRHHRDQPLSDGVPREEIRERLFGRGHPALFERAVDDLVQAGVIVARDRLKRATHRVALSSDEERASFAIEAVLRKAGLKPPDATTLAEEAGVSPAIADRVVKLLHRQKRLVKIDTLFFHDDALRALKADVARLKEGGAARIDVATFKERFGVSRKFAIPLLEYLDRERVTRRVGDSRVLL